MKKLFKNLLPLLLIGSIPFSNLFYWTLNNTQRGVYDLTTDLDRFLPLIKVFIIPYMTLWFFLAFCFVYLCFKNRKVYYKIMITLILCYVVAFITFYFFQTTVTRPIVTGEDIFSKLILFTYSSDMPYNCFPSIHVITTYLAVKGINLTNANKRIKFPVNVVGFLIIISTQFIKQHVIMDIFFAIFLCEVFFIGITYIEEYYKIYNSKKAYNLLEKDIKQ
ncbi:phosphatase PAP2 family protein [Clostridium tagluense]|uniref:phosphatase PAP2 family protein n=1 Tax=Clostridium TaxID=1485 RepID=UPI0013E928F8|nr:MULTISPECIES: phosphatase PAP2 family protein [Clostridium]MBU3126548.1 phosphatase PAP2 family protein [Clostridium tagluense]MBZ9624441.1 phosphatase PAP2 family protein [Clostridium sp. FP2]MCB2309916.1 phosphatase PAP2 family protein [Clostridium tagluense]MCB2314554.1 phosphatase PAP2 family protein [Clostridium tagluense]MCB2319402.1 phosphatase PAP2 family protein [Clostridium tagluense]